MPDGTGAQKPRASTPAAGLAAADKRLALRALATYAELACRAAEKKAVEKAAPAPPSKPDDPVAPFDQVAADWATRTSADEKIIDAYLGFDARTAEKATDADEDDKADATHTSVKDDVSASRLEKGELAALGAFDRARSGGADVKDALFAAIEAADQVDASAAVGRALGEQPPGFRFGLKALSVSEADLSIAPTMADLSEKDGPVSAKAFNSSAYAMAQADISDAAFGLGFEFTHAPLEAPDAESTCPFDQGRDTHRDDAGALHEAARIDDRDEPVVGDDYLWGRVDDDPSAGDRERRSESTGTDNTFGYAGDDMVLGGQASKRLFL